MRFPPGAYACHSIHLKSQVALHLKSGAIILAAPGNGFDAAESNAPFESYQDFGHNHWHNGLIWGEDVHDVAIIGPGLICGRGLSRGEAPEPGLPSANSPGVADKAIALKRCRNVIVCDVAILAAGHFAILATGVDNLTLEALKIDTNRDGINVDCCRNVRISSCSVNSPWDDGICLKSSFALGEQRATENVTINDCYVTGGFALGTMLNGTFRRADANDGQPTGLDLAELGFGGVDPEATGRPSYHPSILLKLYIYGYLNRVQSSRRLEYEAGRNVEVMWL